MKKTINNQGVRGNNEKKHNNNFCNSTSTNISKINIYDVRAIYARNDG